MDDKVNPYRLKLAELPEFIIPFYDHIESSNDPAIKQLQDKMLKYDNVSCELGCGSGQHLLELAHKNQNTLYVGFEIRYKRIYSCAKKAHDSGISNIILLRTFAQDLLEYFIPQSISTLYINFPDPWDKRRWQKHRLITTEFLQKIITVLKPEGVFSYKTDHKEYFDQVIQIIKSLNSLSIYKYSEDLHKSEHAQQNILTEFESLFKSKGLPVFFVETIKVGI